MENDVDRCIYALSDGRSSREIGKLLGTSHKTVGRRWTEWHSQGLMRDSRRFKGRREATFSFEELGLPLPSQVAAMREIAVAETPESENDPGTIVAPSDSAKVSPSFEEKPRDSEDKEVGS